MSNLSDGRTGEGQNEIDAVLLRLSEVEVPADLESSVLRALAAQGPERTKTSTVLAFVQRQRAMVLFATAFAAGVALFLVIPRKIAEPPSRTKVATASPSPVPAHVIATQVPLRRVLAPDVRARHRRTVLASTRMPAQTQPANRFAAPLPLTAQEELLVQLGRTLTPAQRASLKPGWQEARLTTDESLHFDHSFPAPMRPPTWAALPETLPAPPTSAPIP